MGYESPGYCRVNHLRITHNFMANFVFLFP